MPIEIDETELQMLRGAEKTLRALNGDGRTHDKYLELVKTLYPNQSIPEVDAKNRFLGEMGKTNEQVAALHKELADNKSKFEAFGKSAEEISEIRKSLAEDKAAREKASQEAKLTSHIDKGRNFLRDKQYTDDGVTAIEKLMQERGLADYEAAEALFARTQPVEVAIPGVSQRSWDLMSPDDGAEESQKLLLANKDRWVRNEIPKILADVRGQARRA